jgi:transaldolase
LDAITTNPTNLLKASKKFDYKNPLDIYRHILNNTDVMDISVETLGTRGYDPSTEDPRIYFDEAVALHEIGGSRFSIKIPATQKGITAIYRLHTLYPHIRINSTLVFDPLQAHWAAFAGATYVSPFYRRLEEWAKNSGIGGNPARDLIIAIKNDFKENNFKTQIIFASVGSEAHIDVARELRPHMITFPYDRVIAPIRNSPEGLTRLYAKLREMQKDFVARGTCCVEDCPDYGNSPPSGAFKHPLLNDGVKKFLADAKIAGYSIL